MPWIDAHMHLFPTARLSGLMRWIHRAFPEHPVPLDVTVEQVLDDLARSGARRCFNLVFPLARISDQLPTTVPLRNLVRKPG